MLVTCEFVIDPCMEKIKKMKQGDFSVMSSFVLETLTISFDANKITDNVISCFYTLPKLQMTIISANNSGMHKNAF